MFRKNSYYNSPYDFDGMMFIDLLQSKLETEDEDPAVAILKGANSMGGHFDLDDETMLYFARYVIAEYSAEPMRVKGNLGWTQFCLIFVENGLRYKLKMDALKEKLKLGASDIVDNGSTISNYAEDPGTRSKAINSDGLLTYINNQSYDKSNKGKVEAINDYYDSLKVSQAKNYIREFRKVIGAYCYLPTSNKLYYEVDVDEDEV